MLDDPYFIDPFPQLEPGTAVFVDGFNLYYGALKGTPYRWLDIGRLCDLALKQHNVRKIYYFTAQVKPRPDKPTAHTDQRAYVRALESEQRLSIHWGQFLTSKRIAHEVGTGRRVKIKHVEEKGSDVNLASYLMLYASRGAMNEAVVITNDSDLVEPIRMVRQYFRIPVGVLNPHEKPSHALVGAAAWVRPIRKGLLAAAQFPEVVHLIDGKTVRRPQGWDKASEPRQKSSKKSIRLRKKGGEYPGTRRKKRKGPPPNA